MKEKKRNKTHHFSPFFFDRKTISSSQFFTVIFHWQFPPLFSGLFWKKEGFFSVKKLTKKSSTKTISVVSSLPSPQLESLQDAKQRVDTINSNVQTIVLILFIFFPFLIILFCSTILLRRRDHCKVYLIVAILPSAPP